MQRIHRAGLIAAVLFIQSGGSAAAEEVVLDLAAAMARAQALAPDSVAARGRIGEAEAATVGAAVRFTDNPELEVEAGPRHRDAISTDVAVRLGQTFPLSGRRGARRAVAAATVVQVRALAAVVDRGLQRDAAVAFYEALHADRVIELAGRSEALARRAADTADRRRRGGDITDLDAGLARLAVGRAKSAVRAAEVDRAEAAGRLAVLVGLGPDDTLVLRGELRPASRLRLADLEPGGLDRVDLRLLGAEARVADAELRVARAAGRPEVGLWVGYRREEDASIFVGGLRVALPVWDRAQGAHAEARAHAARVAAEYQAHQRAAARQVRDGFTTYERAREAVEVFEAEVLPILDESEALLGKSVEAGTLAVPDYLVARQELLEGRREYLDRLRVLAEAHVAAQLTAGVSP